MNFLLMVLLLGCQDSKKYTINIPDANNIPDTMPPIFQVQTGLNPELKDAEVVFEKYVQTRMGTASATRLYANGDFYKIYLGADESLKDDNISWKKVGIISKNGLEKIQKISNNSVIDFINKGAHKKVVGAGENVNWYFYFDQPKFVQSQVRPWQWQWWRNPKFVGKMEKIIKQNLIYE